MKKLKTYHINEKQDCEIHGRKMVQVPCTMYVYCPNCNEEALTPKEPNA